jgi:hypothetical protein
LAELVGVRGALADVADGYLDWRLDLAARRGA